MPKSLVEQYVQDPRHMRLFQQERAIYEVTTLIEETMDAERVTRAELAKKLGKGKSWVTQLLDGEGNKTIRTVADALAVLGYEFRAFAEPIRIGRESTYRIVLGSDELGCQPRVWEEAEWSAARIA
jgi:transcriptional regulator with XRE-family HTH domain